MVPSTQDLAALACEINAEHDAGQAATRKGLDHYRAARKALLRAKEICGHGGWLRWLAENCPRISDRQARRYMELAKSDVTTDLPLEEQEAEWRRICGNAPREEPDDEEGGDGEPQGPRLKQFWPDPDIPAEGTGDPPPKAYSLSVPPDMYEEFVRRLRQRGEDFGTGDDDFKTIFEALGRCATEVSRG
jgi:hypothetical protein